MKREEWLRQQTTTPEPEGASVRDFASEPGSQSVPLYEFGGVDTAPRVFLAKDGAGPRQGLLARARRTDNDEIIEGYYSEFHHTGKNGLDVFPFIRTVDGEINDFLPVSYYTVARCSGLHDKNKKLIFQGDIVRFEYRGKTIVSLVCSSAHHHNADFGGLLCVHVAPGVEYPLDWIDVDKCEVIGNLYDNSDLLPEDWY